MFNFINNFFKSPENQTVENSASSDDGDHKKEREQKKEEKKYLEQEEQDEVRIGGYPMLTEDEILSMTYSYISNLKQEHSDNEKVVKKLDKFLENFNVRKFMKNNPNMTSPDFYMVIYNETIGLVS